jgi:hypothetical protein
LVLREKWVPALERDILLSFLPFAFLGVVTITSVGVAVFSERSFVRGFPYFRGFIPGYGLC